MGTGNTGFSGIRSGAYVHTDGTTTAFGIGIGPTGRTPIGLHPTINPAGADLSPVGGSDVVAIGTTPLFAGDFSHVTWPTGDTGYLWGHNLFTETGSAVGDLAGATQLVGALLETAVQLPAGAVTLGVVRGAQAQASFFGASAGSTVTQMESMRVSAPAQKNGATAGTATNVYSLFVENTPTGLLGSTTTFALYVEGGNTRFGGRVDVSGTLTGIGGGNSETLTMEGGFSNPTTLTLTGISDGGSMVARLGWGSGTYSFQNSNTNQLFGTNAAGSFLVGYAALATTATDGFLYIPTCAGAPTGTPTAATGLAPIVFDTTDNKIWFYNGTWKGVAVA